MNKRKLGQKIVIEKLFHPKFYSMGFQTHQISSLTHNHVKFFQDHYIEFQVCSYKPFMTFEKLRVIFPEETFSFSSFIPIKGLWDPEDNVVCLPSFWTNIFLLFFNLVSAFTLAFFLPHLFILQLFQIDI